jgi:hypothetical protein
MDRRAPQDTDDDGGTLFDPLHRELCADGACIGLVGEDGRCKECGRPGEGARPPYRGRGAEPVVPDPPGYTGPPLEPEVAGDQPRELCPDGSCIGLIGADRRCRLCGHPAATPA